MLHELFITPTQGYYFNPANLAELSSEQSNQPGMSVPRATPAPMDGLFQNGIQVVVVRPKL